MIPDLRDGDGREKHAVGLARLRLAGECLVVLAAERVELVPARTETKHKQKYDKQEKWDATVKAGKRARTWKRRQHMILTIIIPQQ